MRPRQVDYQSILLLGKTVKICKGCSDRLEVIARFERDFLSELGRSPWGLMVRQDNSIPQ